MSDGTHIEWTDATWNIVTGCSVVSAGCKHCYAMKLAGTRLRNDPSRRGLTVDTQAGPVWNGHVRFNGQWLSQPLRWRRPRRIFVCAHGDLFHENVPDEWIDKVFAVMALSPRHTFQVLTKRPDRMLAWATHGGDGRWGYVDGHARRIWRDYSGKEFPTGKMLPFKPLPNVWLGTSVEDQAAADERVPHLIKTPAAVRFLSCEPLLGPIDFHGRWCDDRGAVHENWLSRFGWVIVGGESGPGARPMHPGWARTLRDQCAALEVAFFFKQWGNWAPAEDLAEDFVPWDHDCIDHTWRDERGIPETVYHVGKKLAGRRLDGREHSEYPA